MRAILRRWWWALRCALEEFRGALLRRDGLDPFVAHIGLVLRQDRGLLDVRVGDLVLRRVPLRLPVRGLMVELAPGDPIRISYWCRGQAEPEAFLVQRARHYELSLVTGPLVERLLPEALSPRGLS